MNGPALAVAGARVALAWYTHEGGSRVQIAWSDDGGRTFGSARRVDAGGALGQVDVAAGPRDAMLVSWLQQREGADGWMARAFAADGTPGAAFMLAAAPPERSSGILRLRADDQGWLAAFLAEDGRGLRCARVLPEPSTK